MKRWMRAALAAAACMAFAFCGQEALAGETSGTEGVRIQDIDIGGMSEEEVREAVDDWVDRALAGDLEFTWKNGSSDGEPVTIPLAELDFSPVNAEETVDHAMNIGRVGNVIARYKEQQDAKNGEAVFDLEFTYDKDALMEKLKEAAKTIDCEPRDATLTREDGAFHVTEAVTGKKVEPEKSVEALDKTLEQGGWDGEDIQVALALDETPAKRDGSDLKKVGDLLGSYSTIYGDGVWSRCANIENGARLLNGLVMYPGDEASFNDLTDPYTAENGWQLGAAYEGGKVVQSYGGGICQVSSTAYNAILLAELEVVERHNHGFTVGYVPLAQDATLAGDVLDLKWKNSTEYPVYMEVTADGWEVTVAFYGVETRPENRTVEYVSQTEGSTPPGEDVITVDGSKPAGYYEVTQSAFYGYTASLYKNVYIDGQLESTEWVNTSTYASAPNYITKGPDEPEETAPPETAPQETPPETGSAPESDETVPVVPEVPSEPVQTDPGTTGEPVQTDPGTAGGASTEAVG